MLRDAYGMVMENPVEANPPTFIFGISYLAFSSN